MPANDDPHGVFSLNTEQQSVVVVGSGLNITRAVVINVTRIAGLFGNASVSYRITGGPDDMMDIEEILGGQAVGRLFMREGQTFSTITVPISSQVGTECCLEQEESKTKIKESFKNGFENSFLKDSLVFSDFSNMSFRCFCQLAQASQQS